MNSGCAMQYEPNADNHAIYLKLYEKYQKIGQFTEKELFNA